ncbi:LexA family transcriptional regulator [Brenneria tiliae]|uniref:Helix-turn-helix domain-containing protein n=1 Tax=Brenneria tiliae TaxID=2914984 RepID=A0ABT0MP78_9GAMM|nr:S24 family peptidase [Brenneria tiliae]MCL2891635.1 helix-turn-helix domain-containing protein [Brenneria tiliae]
MKKDTHSLCAARIAQVLAENGWSQSELARQLGVTPQSVQYWVSGKNAPAGKRLQALSALSGYPEYWFFMPTQVESADASYRVEILDISASAGSGQIVSSDFVETVRAIEYSQRQGRTLFGGKPDSVIKVITVNGDSMSDTIEPGDQIFVDISVHTFEGDGIYVFTYGATLHVKRLQMLKDRLLVLSDNQKYQPWSVDKQDEAQFHIMAKVLLRQSIDYKRLG